MVNRAVSVNDAFQLPVEVRTALKTTFSGVSEAIAGTVQTTVRKLADDVGDVKILVLGDSTWAQTDKMPFTLFPQLQALYPHRSLRRFDWSTGSSTYSAATTVAAGTGATKIDWYQGAVSGTVPESVWATFDAQIAAVQPDLILIHFGHNYGATAAGGGYPSDTVMDYTFRERMTRFVAEVMQVCPQADIMITSQNPYLTVGTRYQLSNLRAQVMRSIATDLGIGYGPILEAYNATGNPAAHINGDGLHPNPAGATLEAATLLPMLTYAPGLAPSARLASPFLAPATSLLTNGTFADFTTPPTLPGWTAVLATLSKDTTNFESKNGYAVKITAAAGAGNTSVYQSLPIKRVRGQIVTFAARMFVATGQGSQPGRVTITGDGVTTVTSGTLTLVRDKFIWVYATARIPLAAAFATVSLIGGAAGSTDACTVDRASAVLGHLPRDA